MSVNRFKPGCELTFKTVVAVRAELYKAVTCSKSKTLCLDLSNVTHCDSAGLALLIEARKLCKQKNKEISIIGIAPETQSLAEFCGVKSILETV